MIVDAHQHFWSLGAPYFDWPTPDLAAIYRDYDPADLDALIRPADVDKTILVQVAPRTEETTVFLDLAARTDFVAGVVGWVDLDGDADRETLQRFAVHPKFRGVRPMLQAIPDVDWILRPGLEPMLAEVQRLGLTFDALVKPPHLDALTTFIDRHPNLAVVVDHGAKPEIARGREGFDVWAPKITAIAERPQVHCKLSGLLTEAGTRTGAEDLRPFVEHLVACFEPRRLMWGSDWPVVELAAPYGGWLDQAKALVARLSRDEQACILGGTARRFYRI
ncbi:amidohydrolase family protein [Microvirga pudoricolor]|uniref:amidohydrolase family protein n=1 Tax=Microvirga pudoricolor TaxID=2778729 RepID=UPI00194FFD48|nr:amidohydrolase family protein [Microvirga pudoricolor]MBM6594727.1 amidohydrolase family protein [Microvirga pudoricolor]